MSFNSLSSLTLSSSSSNLDSEYLNTLSQTQLERLTEWGKAYKGNYVAHGVVERNEEAVLKDGRLRCGENVLRKTKMLEFEGGSMAGSRERISLPQNIQDENLLKSIKSIQKGIIERFDVTDEDIEKTILYIDQKAEFTNKKIPKDRELTWEEMTSDEFNFTPDEKWESLPGEYLYSKLKTYEFQSTYEGILSNLINKHPQMWDEKSRPRSIYALPALAIYID